MIDFTPLFVQLLIAVLIVTLGVINRRASKKLDTKVSAVHVLVNGSYSECLAANLLLSQRIYALTGNPEDGAACDRARKLLDERKQAQALARVAA